MPVTPGTAPRAARTASGEAAAPGSAIAGRRPGQRLHAEQPSVEQDGDAVATRSISTRMCEVTRMAMSAGATRISSRTSMIWRGSRPLVGSSRTSSFGSTEQRLRDRHALTVAARELADRARGPPEGEPRAGRLDRAPRGRAVEPASRPMNVRNSCTRMLRVERHVLGNVADAAPRLQALRDDVEAADLRTARRWPGGSRSGCAGSWSCPSRSGRAAPSPRRALLRTRRPDGERRP